ncbi:Electron-transferring-flavoproteindehydrogenase [Desulfofarcimen acetoxidans DSM 771]|uniref:Electron-transferring-flavoproteindehydrogenase n=1 Tax=Desulfofarcimen acetoxidans (strain ATCC 49208 / DSM 771 / KCTC 5769 / VKM B-1644 / 5575) TaxID=485916 RepID=C8VZJ8_DESAS|nr:FAD-dependent oxidoreductase [Desulfofarcimen acetoxidans]ACV64943.1 Electron-transferring-flavoproteindehydrogenase [Desulfofarcimen acetoxidans DSM 771]
MKQFDAIVVGGGPAGTTAALVLARAGMRVVVLERGEYPGAKNVSGAALYGTRLLERLHPGFWLDAPIERYITRKVLGFMSEHALTSIDFKSENMGLPPYNAFTVIRPKFDRWLALKAEEAGALIISGTVVDGLIKENGVIKGVRTRRDKGELYADIVIAADGVNSFLAREAGLQRELKANELSLGIKEIIALDRQTIEERFQLSGNEGVTHEFVGSVTGEATGGGFLYTNEDSLSIGVIMQVSSMLENRIRPYELLEKLKSHPSVRPLVRGGLAKEYSAHMIPEGGWKMFPKLFAPGLLVAGDAAGMVLATGYYLQGINYAMISGEAAAETAIEAIKKKEYSVSTLAKYELLLKEKHVLTDFKNFQNATDILNNRRFQNLYPEIICCSMEKLFAHGESSKQKLVGNLSSQVKDSKASWLKIALDLFEGGRALGW